MPVAFDALGLQTYFTAGPTETKAWTITKGMTAPQVGFVLSSCHENGVIDFASLFVVVVLCCRLRA